MSNPYVQVEIDATKKMPPPAVLRAIERQVAVGQRAMDAYAAGDAALLAECEVEHERRTADIANLKTLVGGEAMR